MVEEATETTETTETKAEETKPETVSKERMDEVLAENTALKEKNELIQQNQAIISANVEATAPKAPAFDPWKEAGLDPDDPKDIPNQEQQKKILTHYIGGVTREIDQIRFIADHPDFPKIVGTRKQIATGQLAEPIMKAIRKDPTLLNRITNSGDPYAAAYDIAKGQIPTETTKTEAEAAIDEAVANANKPKSASNTKGGDGLSEEGRTANLSDADFIKAFNSYGGDL